MNFHFVLAEPRNWPAKHYSVTAVWCHGEYRIEQRLEAGGQVIWALCNRDSVLSFSPSLHAARCSGAVLVDCPAWVEIDPETECAA